MIFSVIFFLIFFCILYILIHLYSFPLSIFYFTFSHLILRKQDSHARDYLASWEHPLFLAVLIIYHHLSVIWLSLLLFLMEICFPLHTRCLIIYLFHARVCPYVLSFKRKHRFLSFLYLFAVWKRRLYSLETGLR